MSSTNTTTTDVYMYISVFIVGSYYSSIVDCHFTSLFWFDCITPDSNHIILVYFCISLWYLCFQSGNWPLRIIFMDWQPFLNLFKEIAPFLSLWDKDSINIMLIWFCVPPGKNGFTFILILFDYFKMMLMEIHICIYVIHVKGLCCIMC